MTAEESIDWASLLGFGDDDDDIKEEVQNDEINEKDEIDLETKVVVDNIEYDECPNCKVKMKTSEGLLCCSKCGHSKTTVEYVEGLYNANLDKTHNVSRDSYMSFKLVGKDSYRYQRSLLKTCSDYKSYSKSNNKKDLRNCIFQYEGKKIPKDAQDLAIDLFTKIKEAGYVYRGNGKKGVLGACLFYACVMKGITKTPREIAAIMNIEERFLSSGDRELQELNEKGIISIPTHFDPLPDYIAQYFPALKIPEKYSKFIIDLIDRAERRNIHIRNDSRTTTKCVGAIYLLTTRVKELSHITKDDIVTECSKISKSTFIRYYNLLMSNAKKIKHVFKKHRIPMPVEWKKIEA